MTSRGGWSLAFALGCLVVGCDGEATTSPDGSAGMDASVDGSVAASCDADTDCDDGAFCNGAERCAPGDAEADARGCVVAAAAACLPDQTCDEDGDDCLSDCDTNGDADGDGHDAVSCGGDDCDDTDALRFAGATEICDAADRDEDCDPTTFGVRDADGDDEPDGACCNDPEDGGDPMCGSDCDDTRAGVNTTATEACNGIDEDCDGEVDEGVTVDLYADTDGDMYGDAAVTMRGCAGAVSGYVADDTDCDDAEASIHPGAADRCDAELVDEDCSGVSNDPPGGCACSAGDSRPCTADGICAAGTESCVEGMYGACSISPEPFEICDGEDDDCNGVVDDGLRRTCWVDGDRDGYAADGAGSSSECTTAGGLCPGGFTERAPAGDDTDCDDGDGGRSPGRTETCNGEDDDCDGMIDEALTRVCYLDEDNDSYAASGASAVDRCPDPGRPSVGECPSSYTNRPPTSTLTTDCNDDPSLGGSQYRPGAPEQCDELDNDCDTNVDEGATVECWATADDDRFAPSGAETMSLCRATGRSAWGDCPANWTGIEPTDVSTRDCNDTDPTTYPGATELCGGGDNNCNGSTSDEDRVTCYADTDNDGFAPSSATAADQCPDASREAFGFCPVGYTPTAPTGDDVDCAPMDGSIHPAVAESCDAPTFVDSNCDPSDEGTVTCWTDTDGDGYAPFSGASMSVQCVDPARNVAPFNGCAVGWTNREPSTRGASDCNDGSGSLRPWVQCWTDNDRDSYRASSTGGTYTCFQSSNPGYGGCPDRRTSRATNDCCDSDGDARPSATAWFTSPRTTCGGYDYDCNGSTQLQYTSTATASSTECTSQGSGACVDAPDGWTTSRPACGESASWLTGCTRELICGPPDCPGATYGCFPDLVNRTQGCH